MPHFRRDQGQKKSKRFVAAYVAGKAVTCPLCGCNIYEKANRRRVEPKGSLFADYFTDLSCIGCGWVVQFNENIDSCARPNQVEIMNIPLKAGASDDDGPGGLDPSAL